jgi:hypothetical protein
MSGQQGWRCTVSVCLHVLQRLSHEGALITRERAMGTREPSCMPRPTKSFFIPKAHSPLRAARHVVALESSRVGRRGLEPWGTWQHWGPLKQGGGVQSRRTRGNTEALPSRETGSEAARHVATLEPSRAGRWGMELRGTWQRQSPPKLGGRIRSYRACGDTSFSLSWT